MRTTLDIDGPILRELKTRAKGEGKSLGRLASDLLARALRERGEAGSEPPSPVWIAKGMGARIDLADPEALYAAMDANPKSEARVAEET